MLGCCLGGGRQGWRSLPHITWSREGNLLLKCFLQEGHTCASVSPGPVSSHRTGKFMQDGESHLLPGCQRDGETGAAGLEQGPRE